MKNELTTLKSVGYSNFADMYIKLNNEVNYFIYSLVKDKETALELTQITFCKVSKNFSSFDSQKAKFKTWVYTIAKNSVIDYFRTEKMRYKTLNINNYLDENSNEYIQLPSDITADAMVLNDELKASIEYAFKQLNEKYKAIANLFFVEGKKIDEIAIELQLPIGSVKPTIMRCREKLQKYLKKEGSEYNLTAIYG